MGLDEGAGLPFLRVGLVIAGDTAFGMLTLDAVEPKALDADDLGLLRLMAGVLAVAMAVP